jgi:hypothetical protein
MQRGAFIWIVMRESAAVAVLAAIAAFTGEELAKC